MSSRPPRKTPRPPRRRAGGGTAFDPYRKWLGIPPDRRPPTYYDLLGVGFGEDDPETLRAAAARRKAAVRPELAGEHADAARRVLYELEEATLVLTDPATRASYDGRLKSRRRRRRPAAPAPARLVGAGTAGDDGEIARLFGTVVAILAVGCLTVYGLTFGFWDKDGVVVPTREPAGVADAFDAPATPAPRPEPADPPPEPVVPLLEWEVVPATAAVVAEADGAALDVTGEGARRTVLRGDFAGGVVRVSASAPGYDDKWTTVRVGPAADGSDDPPAPPKSALLALAPTRGSVARGPVDLIHAYDFDDCEVKGDVEFDRTDEFPHGRWRLGRKGTTGEQVVVRFPFAPADEYRLTVRVRFEDDLFITGLSGRERGGGTGRAGLVSGPSRADTVGARSYLQFPRGRTWYEFPDSLIPDSSPVTLTFDVTPADVTARNDRGAEIRWSGRWSSFSEKPLAAADLPPGRDLFFASWGGGVIEQALYEPAGAASAAVSTAPPAPGRDAGRVTASPISFPRSSPRSLHR